MNVPKKRKREKPCCVVPIWLSGLFALAFFYADFATDLLLVLDLLGITSEADSASRVCPDTAFAGYAVLGALCMLPLVFTIIDCGGRGIGQCLGIFLNITNLRMLYLYLAPYIGTLDEAATSRSTHDAKLIEAVLESMPQLCVQFVPLTFCRLGWLFVSITQNSSVGL